MIDFIVSRSGTIRVDTDNLEEAYAAAEAASASEIDWCDGFEATDHVLEEDM